MYKKTSRARILNSVGLLMGISPQAIRYSVQAIETIFEGVQKKSTCDVLHGIEIFTNLKRYTTPRCFDEAFDLLLKSMSQVTPTEFQKHHSDEIIFSLCFELPSLLKGVQPSRYLVDFGNAYGKYIILSERVRNEDCDESVFLAKNTLLKAKMNLETEWKGSKLALVFLRTVLEPIFENYENFDSR